MSFSEFIGEREREIKAEVNRLQAENKALKKQLSEIKYLNRVEVEKIINNLRGIQHANLYDHDWDNAITAIYSLAYKPITKERIIGVLQNYKIDEKLTRRITYNPLYKKIANEISGDDKNE